MTPAILIDRYIKLRNKRELVRERHARELEPYTDTMRQIETTLLEHLDNTKLDSVKAAAGTAYKQLSTSVTVQDWRLTLDYIKQHEAWDLLEARVAKTATLTKIEDSGQPVPGLKISQAYVLRVRVGQG
jgi:hypothetical protein